MQKILLLAVLVLLFIPLVIAGLCFFSPTTKGNTATFEDQPLAQRILPLTSALTLAQIKKEDGNITTLLVVKHEGETLQAVDLADIGAAHNTDIFAATAHLTLPTLIEAAANETLVQRYEIKALLPSGGHFDRHVATGTNFIDHASETNSHQVFNFPKFGQATPARTTVAGIPHGLLDFEVEFCVRFDRDIRSAEDFDAARKAFFLCADFTNRVTLVRLIDPNNYNSGAGFSDAKSGPGFFPTGPFVVIPNDWQRFIANERMTTRVNGTARQDARGSQMMLDFRQLVERVLDSSQHPKEYLYQGNKTPLLLNGVIPKGAALMSGTSAGVIFTPPTLCDKLAGVGSAIVHGQATSRNAVVAAVKEHFLQSQIKSGHFLQVGDVIEYGSSSMGDIRVEVRAPGS